MPADDPDRPDQAAGESAQAPAPGPCPCRSRTCSDRFARLGALPAHTPAWQSLRNELVEDHLFLAREIAMRFRRSGMAVDDLLQVAALSLVQAVDRFEAERGVRFVSFAVPTISGGIKRYFRDSRWLVQVPRRVKSLFIEVSAARDELTQRFGRAPTVADLARHLRVSQEQVLEALQAHDAYMPLSLDVPVEGGDEDSTLGEQLGAVDPKIEAVDDAQTLKVLIAGLPPIERRVLVLRFFDNLTQSEIAARVHVSQMQVSRLLRRSLDRLRREFYEAASTHAA